MPFPPPREERFCPAKFPCEKTDPLARMRSGGSWRTMIPRRPHRSVSPFQRTEEEPPHPSTRPFRKCTWGAAASPTSRTSHVRRRFPLVRRSESRLHFRRERASRALARQSQSKEIVLPIPSCLGDCLRLRGEVSRNRHSLLLEAQTILEDGSHPWQ